MKVGFFGYYFGKSLLSLRAATFVDVSFLIKEVDLL